MISGLSFSKAVKTNTSRRNVQNILSYYLIYIIRLDTDVIFLHKIKQMGLNGRYS